MNIFLKDDLRDYGNDLASGFLGRNDGAEVYNDREYLDIAFDVSLADRFDLFRDKKIVQERGLWAQTSIVADFIKKDDPELFKKLSDVLTASALENTEKKFSELRDLVGETVRTIMDDPEKAENFKEFYEDESLKTFARVKLSCMEINQEQCEYRLDMRFNPAEDDDFVSECFTAPVPETFDEVKQNFQTLWDKVVAKDCDFERPGMVDIEGMLENSQSLKM